MKKEIKMPIIVCPGSWEEALRDWLFREIIAERFTTALIDVIKSDNDQEQVGDYETMAYLMTLCKVKPLRGEWMKIYQYLTTSIMKKVRQVEVSTDIRIDELGEYETKKLKELKSWLFRQRGRKLAQKSLEIRKANLLKVVETPSKEEIKN